MKSALTRLLAIIVVLAMVVTPALAVDTPQANGPHQGLDRSDLVPLGTLPASDKYVAEEPDKLISLDKESTYIVLFEGDSLVVSTGGALQFDSKQITSQDYLQQLAVKREGVLDVAEAKLGRSLEVTHVYDVILNGAAVKMSAEEAAILAGMPGIRKIMLSETQTLDTDAGPMWIGAGSIWDGTAVPDGVGNKGEGILVGMIDSGINFDHPSFSDTPADGFVYEWEGDYLGVCATDGDPDYAEACNDKLVGAYTYTDDNPAEPITPEDSNGHGTHTASTVAGNAVEVEFQGETVTISGVAPHAQIIAYDACYPTPEGGSCEGDDLLAAVQQAVLDGVDIINYSISGGETPYSDPVELAFLEAFDAGVVVSASAGNDGPDAATVAHLSPWVITTAASTHNRKFTSQVNFSNPLYQGIATLAGEVPFSQEVLDSPVVYAGEDEGNDLGCDAFPADFFAGSIALIRRGTCTFSDKINNAATAGATGVFVFTDDRAPGAMSAPGTTIPNVMLDISGVLGQEIADWVAAQTDETVDVSPVGYYMNDAYGDIMADFSSRGPNRAFDVLKPDVSAPGMEILAAVADSTITPSPEAEYDLYQGTSMSSPHDAGAAALLYAQHPDWTPAMIKSALMLTGYDGLIKEDKTTPADLFDMGAGRVALELAGLTGLVMDETYDNMLAADPEAGGDVRTLNIASLYNSECVGSCSWTRTFTSVADASATYTVAAPEWVTVTPTSFTILPGATQEVTFEVDATALPGDEWAFGNIEFMTEDLFAGGDPIVLVEQDFTNETFPPTDWAIYDVDLGDPTPSNWARAIDQSFSAPASAKHKYDCTQLQEGWLVSPQFTVPADGTTSLQFFQRGNYVADVEYHGIMVSTGSGDPAVGDFVELVMPPTPPEDAWTTTPVTVDLSAYAGQQIYVAFVYEGNCADDWWIDDVLIFNQLIGTSPISDVAVPVAVMPVAGNIPDWVSLDSHRDTDFATLTDLLAVEITDFTVDTFGFVKGEPNEIQLAQDPTNGDPFDDLDQVYYTLIDMTNGAARLVAEITATTATDLDLFWGFDINGDGMPQEDEVYESSATATAFEYLSDWGFPAPFYDVWVLVQNWQGSGAPLDDITLTLGVVGYDRYLDPSMQVIGPETNAAFTPFDIDVVWSGIDTEEGDRLYGLFDAYADAAYDVPIGLTEVDVVRGVDDVVKTADVETAIPGDTITYTLAVTNYKDHSIEYSINDLLPEGVTYVPDSVTGGAVYDELTNAITWTGTIDPGYYNYDFTTSAEDPACTLEIMPDGNPDAYLDWKTTSYGFSASPTISGDSKWYGAYVTYPPFNYYGVDHTGMEFTDDGYAGFDMVDVDYVNQNLPDPLDPNNVLAMFWDDLVIQYDAVTNKGVTMVGDNASFATIEYDDVYRYDDDPAVTLDFEIGYFLQPDDAPGAYEIVFAYDNIYPDFDLSSSTIGVENVDGTVGTTFVYNDATLEIENGSAICFDYVFVPPTHTITFQVTVDEGFAGLIVNEALHNTDEVYTVEETAVWEVLVEEPLKFLYLPLIMR